MQLVATILKKASLESTLSIHQVFILYVVFSRTILLENRSQTWLLTFMIM